MEKLVNFLELVHANDPKGIMVTDKNGIIIFCNEKLKQILKLKTDIIGKDFCQGLSGLLYRHNELSPLLEPDLKRFLARVISSDPQNNDARLVLPEMAPIFVEHCSHAFAYEENQYVFMHITDVSEKIRSQNAQNLAKRTDNHDIRAHLNIIIGFSQIIESRENDNFEEIAKFGSYIYKAANNILQIGENQSLIAQIQTGQYLPEKRDCDFLNFLKKEIIFSLSSFTNRGMEIKTSYPGDANLLSHILIDTRAIKPMLINLVKNALEAAEKSKQKTINISAEIISGLLQIKLHNPGSIPKEIRHSFMNEGATFGKEDGSGLGAFSAKLLAEALNGSITWETSDETGTTIAVSLPV